jgi:hypothetical protein
VLRVSDGHCTAGRTVNANDSTAARSPPPTPDVTRLDLRLAEFLGVNERTAGDAAVELHQPLDHTPQPAESLTSRHDCGVGKASASSCRVLICVISPA